ncbi:MAG: DUF4747 family protein [Saprospiraceae bacterium]|nr:DUF4747 family protein [Candidatus Defluviibacterium haderslevense]
METFYFGRLNLMKGLYSKEKNITDLLNHGFILKKLNINYGIFNVELIKHDELGNIITGKLVKYQDNKKENVIVKDSIISQLNVPGVILGNCEFYLLEKTHLIAYNPYGRIISSESFCKNFTEIILLGNDSMLIDSQIHPVVEEFKFLEFLRSMKVLKKFTVSLVPSNPNNRDLWKAMDERLRNMNVSKYKETLEADKNEGLKIDKLTESKIHMAEDGYGKATGEGVSKDGTDITISTNEKESIIKKKIEQVATPDEKISSLKLVFDKINERFTKENTK